MPLVVVCCGLGHDLADFVELCLVAGCCGSDEGWALQERARGFTIWRISLANWSLPSAQTLSVVMVAAGDGDFSRRAVVGGSRWLPSSVVAQQ